MSSHKILFLVIFLFLFILSACTLNSSDDLGASPDLDSDVNYSNVIKSGILATVIPTFDPTATLVPVPTNTPYPTKVPNELHTPKVQSSDTETKSKAAPSSPPYPIPDLDPAPQFSLKLFDQDQFDVVNQNGKPILLVFWAPWCPYCHKELPVVELLYPEYLNAGVDVLGIAILADFDESLNFYNEQQFTFPSGWDEENSIAKKYEVTGVPSFRLIDKAGNLDLEFSGARGESVLRRVMIYASQ